MGRFSPTDVPIMEVHNRQGKAVNSRGSVSPLILTGGCGHLQWTSSVSENFSVITMQEDFGHIYHAFPNSNSHAWVPQYI